MFYHITAHQVIGSRAPVLLESYYSSNTTSAISFFRTKLQAMGISNPTQLMNYEKKLTKDGEVRVRDMVFAMEKTDYNPAWSMDHGGKKQKGGMCGCMMQNGKKCPYAGKYGGKCKRHM